MLNTYFRISTYEDYYILISVTQMSPLSPL
jgi:hypothetical protein